jgi:hypothetical protein
VIPSAEQIGDLRLAASKLTGSARRAFQAEMALKYCGGSARRAKRVFGWDRQAVACWLGERRTGIECLGAHAAFAGRPRWETRHPQAAAVLRELAEAHAQQDPTFRTPLAFTRLTAKAALEALRAEGIAEEQLPSPSTLAEVLNRMGYRLRKVVKAKPQKKIKETDAIFDNINKKDGQSVEAGTVRRLSMDCKATVGLGEFSRGGRTRGDHQACDHDMGCEQKYIPCGIVDEDTGHLYLNFGSSYKTSDFIVDTLTAWWESLDPFEQAATAQIQLKVDNGPESSGVRTQFLNRMVQFADQIDKPIQLLYFPPYHSKYNPIERCWGILEQHWNGTLLVDVQTMLAWAKSMTWKGLHPVVELSGKVYRKGVKLTKAAMRAVEARLKRNPLLPKWDILIRPVEAS